MNDISLVLNRKIIQRVTLLLTLCALATGYGSYVQFEITNRGGVRESITDFFIFYGRGRVEQETLILYAISILCVLIYLGTLDRLLPATWKIIIRAGIIALLIAPSVFVNPEHQPAIADLLIPHKRGLAEIVKATIMPAWRSIWKNGAQETYSNYKLVANMLSIWPIFFCWSILLWLQLAKIRRKL